VGGGAGQAGAFTGGAAGSLGEEKDEKVCVQTPGSVARGGLTGAASTRGVDGFTGSSSIWIKRVMPNPDSGGVLSTGLASATGAANGSRTGAAGPGIPGATP
jgi:hypothetical protein